jgi:AraC-like DNA-binding protein
VQENPTSQPPLSHSPASPDGSPYACKLEFQDFEDMEAAIRHADARLYQRGAGRLRGGMLSVRLPHATLQCGWQQVGHVSYAALDPGMCGLLLALQSDGESNCNGHAIHDGGIVLYGPSAEHFAFTTAGAKWATFILPVEELSKTAAALAGWEPDQFPKTCRLVQPDRTALRALHDTLLCALSVAESSPEVLQEAAARSGMEHSILTGFMNAMACSEAAGPWTDRAALSHSRAVARAQEFCQGRWDTPIYIADLCAASGVSERTLRNAFLNIYGISPNRYLKMRRLDQVRRTLKRADPDAVTVGRIATQFGFWDMSRFAVDYKALFGESPSRTLRVKQSDHTGSTAFT